MAHRAAQDLHNLFVLSVVKVFRGHAEIHFEILSGDSAASTFTQFDKKQEVEAGIQGPKVSVET